MIYSKALKVKPVARTTRFCGPRLFANHRPRRVVSWRRVEAAASFSFESIFLHCGVAAQTPLRLDHRPRENPLRPAHANLIDRTPTKSLTFPQPVTRASLPSFSRPSIPPE